MQSILNHQTFILSAFPKTEEKLKDLLSFFTTFLMIGGFAIMALGIYEFILSLTDTSEDPRAKRKGISLFLIGLLLVSSKAILNYLVGEEIA